MVVRRRPSTTRMTARECLAGKAETDQSDVEHASERLEQGLELGAHPAGRRIPWLGRCPAKTARVSRETAASPHSSAASSNARHTVALGLARNGEIATCPMGLVRK